MPCQACERNTGPHGWRDGAGGLCFYCWCELGDLSGAIAQRLIGWWL